MDPNANLTMIRVLVTDLLTNQSLNQEALAQTGLELAEHVDNLDEWICKGGFLPAAWARGPAND